MKMGTYKQCSNCKIKENCCADFKYNIDNVMLEEKEYLNIIEKFNISEPKKYFSKINEKVCNIKNKNGICPFYKNRKCLIYDYRPNDCKLYPFDILKRENNYYLILYNTKCIDINEFIKENARLDKIIDEIKPWIETYTDDNNFTKLKTKINKNDYIIIKKININNGKSEE